MTLSKTETYTRRAGNYYLLFTNSNLMRKLFVTGGAGFIGSAFIRLALAELPDCRITNFDALTYAGNPDNLAGMDERRYSFVHGDISDREAVAAALAEGADAVINFAAETHVDRSIADATEFLRTNITGTQVLLDAARARGVQRFVHISTDEVMGSLPEDDEAAFFTESSPLDPKNPYAATKAAAEHLVHAAHHTHGLDTVITRCGNNYGPRQFPEKLIPLVIANALRGEAVPVYGDGRNVRDWLYVTDHCDALRAVLAKGRPGQTYNIGGESERDNNEVVQTLCRLLEQARPRQSGSYADLIAFVTDRAGHDRRYAVNISKIRSELGWQPAESFETGLAKTVQWYLANLQRHFAEAAT